MTRHNRRDFLKHLWGFLLIPYLVLLALMTNSTMRLARQGTLTIRNNIPEGVSFYSGIICIRKGTQLTFLSDRCTHLGCRINHADNDRLICPCHGSAFDLNGSVVKGPAIEGLRVLDHKTGPQEDEITIYL